MTDPQTDDQVDVLIVGAGPVGLAAAIMLERLGVSCMLVERRSGLHTAPQAHVISSRSLEICRAMGIDDADIRAGGTHPGDSLHIRWVDHLVGRDLGVYSMASDLDQVARMFAQTPTPTCNLSQDQFEALLAGRLSDKTPIRFRHSWVGCRPSGTADGGYVSDIETREGARLTIGSRFIIGADGAGSRVRQAMGAEMEGPHHIQHFINIHFHANLREHLKGREGLLYWVMDPDCVGTFIAHDIDHNWIFMKTVGADEPLDPIDEDRFAALLQRAIGKDVPHEIQSQSSWVMTAQVSSAYQKDGLFLIGDAAHRFPPTGGIGMNTGFQDAHNLTWKLAMVLKGADPDLLSTYEPERRPSAVSNSKQSHQNFLNMVEVAKALDADGDGIATMDDFDKVLASEERKAYVQAAVDHQAAHFNMSGLDLGVCYTSSAIVADGAPPVSPDPVSHYVPSTTPGARLPHVWLRQGEDQISTLDLVKGDRYLVLSFGDRGADVQNALEGLKAASVPVEHVAIAPGGRIVPADDQYEDLFAPDQILVVRPDGHIATRIEAAQCSEELRTAISVALPV